MRVRLGDELAEVAIADRVLAQQRYVMPVVERELGTRDRPDVQRMSRRRELHRPVQSVVVRQGEGRVTLLRCRGSQLDRMRSAVEEGKRRVAMQLYVGHERMFAQAI